MSAASPLLDARAVFFRDVRIELDLTQADFGALVGAHPATVSRWESGRVRPNSHQRALIAAFQTAIDRGGAIRPDLDAVIASAGPVYGLYLILHAAHGVRWFQ
jgi:DNA-binding XRE family transcriptional regulator